MIHPDLADLKKELKSLILLEGEELCKYCGIFVATDKEHVIPQNWLLHIELLRDIGVDIKSPGEIIVPSCHMCNAIASDTIFRNFAEKRAFIREKMRKRYKRYLNVELWEDNELDELGGMLQKSTILFNEIAKIIKLRLG